MAKMKTSEAAGGSREAKFEEIKVGKLRWLYFSRTRKREADYLARNFQFDDLETRACLPPIQRPRLYNHDDYIFMILQFPVYRAYDRVVTASEVDFFLTGDTLVTVNDGSLASLADFFKLCQDNPALRKRSFRDAGTLMLALLDYMLDDCLPMLNHINLDVDAIEDDIFVGHEKAMVKEISIIKRNIINFRKTMQLHKNIIRKLVERAPNIFNLKRLELSYYNVIANTKEIWDSLTGYKDSIDALHQTNESLISFKTNEIIKTLTIFSVIVFPLTLLASIFGMNVVRMPFVKDYNGFLEVLALMAVLSLIMLAYFKRRKWL